MDTPLKAEVPAPVVLPVNETFEKTPLVDQPKHRFPPDPPIIYDERSTTCRFVFIELCAGTANLSKTISQYLELDVIPVDYDRNQHHPRLPVVRLDLASPTQTSVILDLIALGHVEFIWMAPPCGTCSRAREIPVPGRKFSPKPLRSEAMPRGLPNLSEEDQVRVDKANRVYDNLFVVIEQAREKGIYVAIENPRRSLLWHFNYMEGLLQQHFSNVDFEHC